MRRAACLAGLLLFGGCARSSLTEPSKPLTEIFNDHLTPAAPIFTTTVGPAPAGPWRADVAYADPSGPTSHPVSMVVRDGDGNVVATGAVVTAFLQTAQWNGGAGARYRVDLRLEDTTGLPEYLGELFTLEVTHPGP